MTSPRFQQNSPLERQRTPWYKLGEIRLILFIGLPAIVAAFSIPLVLAQQSTPKVVAVSPLQVSPGGTLQVIGSDLDEISDIYFSRDPDDLIAMRKKEVNGRGTMITIEIHDGMPPGVFTIKLVSGNGETISWDSIEVTGETNPSPTITETPSPTSTPTATPTATPSNTATPQYTAIPNEAPPREVSPVPSYTTIYTPIPTSSVQTPPVPDPPSITPTPTKTSAATATHTPTPTKTPAATITHTPALTSTPTRTVVCDPSDLLSMEDFKEFRKQNPDEFGLKKGTSIKVRGDVEPSIQSAFFLTESTTSDSESLFGFTVSLPAGNDRLLFDIETRRSSFIDSALDSLLESFAVTSKTIVKFNLTQGVGDSSSGYRIMETGVNPFIFEVIVFRRGDVGALVGTFNEPSIGIESLALKLDERIKQAPEECS